MRKPILCAIVLMAMNYAISQNAQTDTTPKKHEVKLNVTNTILLQFLDGSYEYLINEESSFGVGILFNIGDDQLLDEYRTFSLTSYYRWFFSKKYAEGFFVEGFGMLNSGDNDSYFSNEDRGTYTDFALGVSLGGKFVTKKGFVAEIYGGFGRNLFDNADYTEIVGRGGIAIGYRF